MSLITQFVTLNIIGKCLPCTSGNLIHKMLFPSICQPSSAARFASSSKNWKSNDNAWCSEKLLLQSTSAKHKNDNVEENEGSQLKSLCVNPFYRLSKRPSVLPRFDELYYRMSDKKDQIYQRTWIEPPELKIVPKKICQFEEEDDLPPLERRSPTERPRTACSLTTHADQELTKLKKDEKFPCLPINLRNCHKGRSPSSLELTPYQSESKKLCAPLPSYSECKKAIRKPLPLSECQGPIGPLCQAWIENSSNLGLNRY